MKVKYKSMIGDYITVDLVDFISRRITDASETGTIERLEEKIEQLTDALAKVISLLENRNFLNKGELKHIIDPYNYIDFELVDEE